MQKVDSRSLIRQGLILLIAAATIASSYSDHLNLFGGQRQLLGAKQQKHVMLVDAASLDPLFEQHDNSATTPIMPDTTCLALRKGNHASDEEPVGKHDVGPLDFQ